MLTSFSFRNPSGIFASTERKFECGDPILRMNTAATRRVPSMILFGYAYAFFKPAERYAVKSGFEGRSQGRKMRGYSGLIVASEVPYGAPRRVGAIPSLAQSDRVQDR